MDETHTRRGAHVVRVLVASGALALGWFIVGSLLSSSSASAATPESSVSDSTAESSANAHSVVSGATKTVESAITAVVRTQPAPPQAHTTKIDSALNHSVARAATVVHEVAAPAVTAQVNSATETFVEPLASAAGLGDVLDRAVAVTDALGLPELTDVPDLVGPVVGPIISAPSIGPVAGDAKNHASSIVASTESSGRPAPLDPLPRAPRLPNSDGHDAAVTSSFGGVAREAEPSTWLQPRLVVAQVAPAADSRAPAFPTFDFDTTPD
jgi:hypothetical protein